jgi:hypothetical protein
LAKRGIDFELHLLPPELFALAQHLPLSGVHPEPAFGVLPEHLLIFWRKVHPAVGRTSQVASRTTKIGAMGAAPVLADGDFSANKEN